MSRRSGHRLLVAGLVATSLVTAGCGSRPVANPTPSDPAVSSAATSASPTPTSPTPVAQTPSTRRPATVTPTPHRTPAPVRCAELAGTLSLRERVGQLMMVAVSSGGVDASAARAIDGSRAGSVILLGNTTAGRARVLAVTEQARESARTPKDVETLLAADQEGGLVQRLRGQGFDRIPSARRQAESSASELEKDAARWGKQLKRAGIDADLAPVADVVPADLVDVNQPIGVLRRGYGSNPTKVARDVAAFVTGMDAAGVATSVKHFPGLGRVRGNTDVTAEVVDDTTTRDDPYLKPFAAGIDAGTDMVMMSSAYYSEIDPVRRAAFSPTVVRGMVRGDFGFTGVVISDDLAAAAMRDLRPGERMLRFLRAGGDLAIVGDPGIAVSMADAVVDGARDDDKVAAEIEAATIRVLQLKDRRGLAHC